MNYPRTAVSQESASNAMGDPNTMPLKHRNAQPAGFSEGLVGPPYGNVHPRNEKGLIVGRRA